jgi:hypothetical protein
MFNNSELVPGFPASIYTGLWSLWSHLIYKSL